MTAARVFVARLADLQVFDPALEVVGRLRDVVAVVPRGDRRPPRVLGLLVEVPQRRRIFVPATRVSSFDPSQVVLTTASLSLKSYGRRPGETLLLGDVLDRSVTIDETGQAGTVIDVGMEQTRERDWLVTRVAVALGGRRLGRRRGEVRQAPWDGVSGIELPDTEQGAANLLAAFESYRPADLATVLQDLGDARRQQVAQALDDDRLADVLEEMSESDQVEILNRLDGERAADVLERMDPDDAVDLLRELPRAAADRLLGLMEADEAADLRRLLVYRDDTAGGLMTTEPVMLPPDATVAEALARVRSPELSPALASQVFVVRPPFETPTGKLLGTCHIQRLLREPPATLVAGVVDISVDPLSPDTSLQAVAAHLATYDLVAVPVTDRSDRLLGAVTVDDVLDHLLPAGWRESSAAPGARQGAPDPEEAAAEAAVRAGG